MGMQLIFWFIIVIFTMVVGSIASEQFSRVDGTAISPSGTPVVSSCGITPIIDGSNHGGTITIGTGVVTACTLNFSSAYASTPTCILSSSSNAIGLGWSTTTSVLTVSMSASLGGGKVGYLCFVP